MTSDKNGTRNFNSIVTVFQQMFSRPRSWSRDHSRPFFDDLDFGLGLEPCDFYLGLEPSCLDLGLEPSDLGLSLEDLILILTSSRPRPRPVKT